MKMRIYKKRKARYAKACDRPDREEWRNALTLYVDANHWYCHNSRRRTRGFNS